MALVAALVSGCSGSPATLPTQSSATPSPSASATTTPSAPELHPDGSAADNLPLFTAVTAQVWASKNKAKGRAYVDALVAAGFPKSAMQVTKDKTTVGNAVESLQFSVLWDDQCLIGQVGPATGAPVTAVMPALEGDTCLIGDTRPIDW